MNQNSKHINLIIKLIKIRDNAIVLPCFFFFGNPRCPGQLTRTTTNPRTYWTPCKPSRQVRHRGSDMRARWGSNPSDRGKETLSLPLGHKPRCGGWVVVPSVVMASRLSIKLGQVVCHKKIVERLVEMRGRWFWCFWRLEAVFVVVSWFLGFFFFNERWPQRTYECFLNFFSIGLTRSHNLNHEFCRLARINSSLIT
jgi:hypothetical protein